MNLGSPEYNAAVLTTGLWRSIFLVDTVTSDHYREILVDFFPFLKDIVVQSEETLFHEDGTRSHTAHAILDVFNEHLGDCVAANHFPGRFGYGWSCPPNSPDLLLGYLNDNVNMNSSHGRRNFISCNPNHCRYFKQNGCQFSMLTASSSWFTE
jgi:hypothetical protein